MTQCVHMYKWEPWGYISMKEASSAKFMSKKGPFPSQESHTFSCRSGGRESPLANPPTNRRVQRKGLLEALFSSSP